MKLSEPESLVYAAAFVASLKSSCDIDTALYEAHRMVLALRGVRTRGRAEQPMIKTLTDFRLDAEKDNE